MGVFAQGATNEEGAKAPARRNAHHYIRGHLHHSLLGPFAHAPHVDRGSEQHLRGRVLLCDDQCSKHTLQADERVQTPHLRALGVPKRTNVASGQGEEKTSEWLCVHNILRV